MKTILNTIYAVDILIHYIYMNVVNIIKQDIVYNLNLET